MGHGGGGVFSISGSACGIGRLANEAISSGVGRVSDSSCGFCAAEGALAEGAAA